MKSAFIDRRAALVRLAGGCLASSWLLQACEAGRSDCDGSGIEGLVPVDVEPDRIIDAVVCLRPYRPSGFRLEAEQTDTTLLIHNYGHGGGGFTLSWGTATQAIQLFRDAGGSPSTRTAVIGCGVVGLTTAYLLKNRGFEVTIYTRDLPPDTTSDLAGASFYPSYVIDDSLLSNGFRRRLDTACRVSHAWFRRLMEEPRYAVEWRPQYFLTDIWNDEVAAGPEIYRMLKDLYPNPRLFGPGEHPFPTRYAFREDNIFIEPSVYLQALLEDLLQAGGRIETRTFRDASEFDGLSEEVVFNCTGLGAAALTADTELTPLPGQQVILQPQPEVDYAVVGDDGAYMFPRSDGVVLGHGAGLRDPTEILSRHRRLVPRRS